MSLIVKNAIFLNRFKNMLLFIDFKRFDDTYNFAIYKDFLNGLPFYRIQIRLNKSVYIYLYNSETIRPMGWSVQY